MWKEVNDIYPTDDTQVYIGMNYGDNIIMRSMIPFMRNNGKWYNGHTGAEIDFVHPPTHFMYARDLRVMLTEKRG